MLKCFPPRSQHCQGDMRRLLYLIDRYLEEALAGVALVVMACLVFAQVVMRYFFHAPMSWSDEVASYCMVWSVYLSAVWAVRERAHIRVLNGILLLPRKLSLGLVLLTDALWLFLAGLVAWQGVVLDSSLWARSYTSPVLGIEQKWPYMIITLGFVLMALRLLQCYVHWIKAGCHGLPTAIPEQGEYHA